MAFSEEYKQKVLKQFTNIGPISAKNMFGGVGIYFEDHFFAVIVEDKLYFKTDETNREDFKRMNMKPWEINKNYYELPEKIFRELGELKVWVDKAVGVAARKKKKIKSV
jgi:DNA transformation protein and related proteins